MDIKALLNAVGILLLLAVAYVSFWVLVIGLIGYLLYQGFKMLETGNNSTST